MIETKNIVVNPRRIARVLAGVVLLLVVLNLMAQGFRYLGYGRVMGFVPEFNLSVEHNVPTYTSSILLFLASLLLGAIAVVKEKEGADFARYWSVLSAIFLYISLDEVATLHERVGPFVHAMVDVSGPFRYAWVIPGMVAVLVFAVAYWPFLWHLPDRVRKGVALAGILYVGGALGVEMLGGWYYSAMEGERDMGYALLATVEETLEMTGTVVFIYALLGYMQHAFGTLSFRFES